MNDEIFNLDLRKFLKRFGVTAQREIERAVKDAIERGAFTGTETLEVRATLTIPGVISELRIDGQIGLDQPASRTSGAEPG
jgi:hypothetical protein